MRRKLPLHSFHVNNSDRTNEAANYHAKWIVSLLYREILIIFIYNIMTCKTDKNNTRCSCCILHISYIGSCRIPEVFADGHIYLVYLIFQNVTIFANFQRLSLSEKFPSSLASRLVQRSMLSSTQLTRIRHKRDRILDLVLRSVGSIHGRHLD